VATSERKLAKSSSSSKLELPFIYPSSPEPQVRAKRFQDLGWTGGSDEKAASIVALEVGLEHLACSTFERGYDSPTNVFMPTAIRAGDPHAYRTLERSSFEAGTYAIAYWPSDRTIRGYNGSLRLSSQIGLVEFPADHALAGLCLKASESAAKSAAVQDVVLTLPAFLPLARLDRIRDSVTSKSKLKLYALPVPPYVAATYFYLYPALGGPRVRAKGAQMTEWADGALRDGRVLVLDWGASGLAFGIVEVSGAKGTTELRQLTAGTWPSLGGTRLTLAIFYDLKVQLTDAILAKGPADLRVRTDTREKDTVFRPPGYDDCWEPQNRALMERFPRSPEALRLRNTLFPTIWHWDRGVEPRGYAPLRKVAIGQFKKLWAQAEQIKKTILADPEKYSGGWNVPWSVAELDSPFTKHLGTDTLPYIGAPFLRRVHQGLLRAFKYVDDTAQDAGRGRVSRVALLGMQGGSRIVHDTLRQYAAGGAGAKPRLIQEPAVAPCAETPLELKSVVNRGAVLMKRDESKVRIAPSADVVPFAIRICDAVGDIEIFKAGPVDELRVFQRRLHVDEGQPLYEFYAYESVDSAIQGSWGVIDFGKPEEFTEADRRVNVDERYRSWKSGTELPRFRVWTKDTAEIEKCFDRVSAKTDGGRNWLDGKISLRRYVPHDEPEALRLLAYIESELVETFRKKVFLLEREFDPPPPTYRYVYQRYYLSKSQELIVVREWWAPAEGKLRRHKTLHICIGSAEAKNLLGLDWGRH
jgi:hypothetical protein